MAYAQPLPLPAGCCNASVSFVIVACDTDLMSPLSALFPFYRHSRVALVGPNGIGKTTLLNLMNGTLQPDTGHVTRNTRRAPAVPRHILAVPAHSARGIGMQGVRKRQDYALVHGGVCDHCLPPCLLTAAGSA